MQHLAMLLQVAINEGITQTEISETISMPQGTTSRNVSKLSSRIVKNRQGKWVEDGYCLLETRPDVDESRRHAVYLTNKGKQFFKDLENML